MESPLSYMINRHFLSVKTVADIQKEVISNYVREKKEIKADEDCIRRKGYAVHVTLIGK
jgi:hypothetical protein